MINSQKHKEISGKILNFIVFLVMSAILHSLMERAVLDCAVVVYGMTGSGRKLAGQSSNEFFSMVLSRRQFSRQRFEIDWGNVILCVHTDPVMRSTTPNGKKGSKGEHYSQEQPRRSPKVNATDKSKKASKCKHISGKKVYLDWKAKQKKEVCLDQKSGQARAAMVASESREGVDDDNYPS